MRALTETSTRTYHCKYVVLVSEKSPARAILLQSPGRKPWVNRRNTFIEPQRGGTTLSRTNARTESAAPTELNPLLSKVYPGFHFGLCPHYTLGFAGVSCLKALVISPYETVGQSLTWGIYIWRLQGIKAMCPALPSWTHHSIYHLNGLLFYREDTQVVLNTTLHCKGTSTYRGGQYLTICILKSDYTYL